MTSLVDAAEWRTTWPEHLPQQQWRSYDAMLSSSSSAARRPAAALQVK